MQEQENSIVSRQELPFVNASSAEFLQAFAALHISEQSRLPVIIHRSPRDAASPSQELTLQQWLLSPTGEKLETALVQQVKSRAAEITLGVAVHGYACAGIPGETPQNYWSAVTAALNVSQPPYPVLAFDLPSYNATPADRKALARHPWLNKIDHYPYVFLQALEKQLAQVEEALWELPAVTEHHGSTEDIPLRLEVMAHSVGGRAVMVAASLDEGKRLSQLLSHWQQRLGRPLNLSLTILEPAFGLQPDLLIQAVNILNNPATRLLFRLNPMGIVRLLRTVLNPLRHPYHLSTRNDLYPLDHIVQAEHLAQIISHPRDIANLPELPVLTPDQLSALGIPTQIIMASQDTVVDNDATRRVLKIPKTETRWAATQGLFDTNSILLRRSADAAPQAGGTIMLNGAGHTVELDAPGMVAALIRTLR